MGGQESNRIIERLNSTYDSYKDIINDKNELERRFDEDLTYNDKILLENNTNNIGYDYLCNKIRLLNKFEKERKKKETETKTYYIHVESDESKRIREQYNLEERNRQNASNELPLFLDKIKIDFIPLLDKNISKIKEKIKDKINKYPRNYLKIFLQNLIQNENIINKLINDLIKKSEEMLSNYYIKSNHCNIVIIGISGVGKSTLINEILDFKESEGAKTGIGNRITEKFNEYISDKRKGLRLIDSQGIELNGNDINKVFISTKELIEKRAREGNPDKLINCIWYCVKSSNLRFQEKEKEILTLLMNQYDDNKLPIIIVLTQNYDDEETEIMTKFIKDEFKFLEREITIVPVVAKEKIIKNRKNKIIIKKDGIKDLIKISFEKSQKAIYPAVIKSIQQKIIQIFEIHSQHNKEKLKINLKEIEEKILNEITENDKIEYNISKFSLLFESSLNIFFEIPSVSEKSKEEINNYLVNLCEWCIGTLNDIMVDLVKENSYELSRLLLNEQTRVKNAYNVQKSLNGEKTLDQYRNEAENELKSYILNKIYYLAVKDIYNIINKYIVEISVEIMNEQFNKIISEFKNIISDEKIKEISNKILQDIINAQE